MVTASFFDMLKELGPAGIINIVIIVTVFILALLVNFITIFKYKSISRCFESKKQTKTGIFSNELLNSIVQEYKLAAKNSLSEVNTQAIIEKSFNASMRLVRIAESFVKRSASILVILGLFGTFWGLTISVTKLIEIISSNIVNDVDINMNMLLQSLSGTASGMGFAFATSLIGIACNIVLTIVYIIASCEKSKESLMVTIEEYLDNTVAIVVSKDKETEYTMLNNILRETFVEFGSKIENSLVHTVEEFGEKLTNVVMDVSVSSQTLDNTVERFDKSLENFAGNMRSLSDFNTNMRNNIQMMDVNFIKVTEALQNSATIINENYMAVNKFSEQVKEVADQITTFNTDILTQIENILSKMDRTVSSVIKFAEDLKLNTDLSSTEMSKLQTSFLNSLHIFNQDLKASGDQIAEAVLRSLDTGNKQISLEVANNIKDALSEILLMLETFKENEKALAKTISVLPQQVMTYNRVVTGNIEGKLDDLKSSVDKIQPVSQTADDTSEDNKKRGKR